MRDSVHLAAGPSMVRLRGCEDGFRKRGVFDCLESWHYFAGEEVHGLAGEVGGEGAELEEAEEVADAEALAVFEELVFDGSGAADDGVGTVFDLLAGFHVD